MKNRLSQIGSLILIFRKNTQTYLPQKPIYKVLLAMVTLGLLIPAVVVVWFFSYVLTQAMMEAGNTGGGILFEILILSVFSMVFGTWVIFALLFFSSDREHLITLPIKGEDLMMAKFTFSYLAETTMEFYVIGAVFGGYFMACITYGEGFSCLNPVAVIGAILGTFFLPLIPMIYSALFSVLLTVILKKVKSTAVFTSTTNILTALFIGLFLLSLKDIGEINMDNYLYALSQGRDIFLHTLSSIFFPSVWLSKAVSEGSMPYLLLFILANVVGMVILYYFGKAFYVKGLQNIAALGSDAKTAATDKDFKVTSPFISSFKREIKTLVRTKAFANNCVYVNLVIPLCVVLLFRLSKPDSNLAQFVDYYRQGNERAYMIVMVIVVAIAFITTALNSIASTSFTREGAHLALVKYIPVSYTLQLMSKAAVSICITYPVLLITDVVLCHYLGAPLKMVLFYALIMLLCHLISVTVGIYLDSISPYVDWEDEYSALRGNVNTYFNMGVMIFAAMIMGGLSFLIYEVLLATIFVYHLLIFLIFATVTAITCGVGFMVVIPRNMRKM